MVNLSHGRVIGTDFSRDWLDLHCLPEWHRYKLPNAPAGHAAVRMIYPRTRAPILTPETKLEKNTRNLQGDNLAWREASMSQ